MSPKINKIFVLLRCYAASVVVTDVSGQPIRPILNGQALQVLNYLILEDGTDRLSQSTSSRVKESKMVPKGPETSVANHQSTSSRVKQSKMVPKGCPETSVANYQSTSSRVKQSKMEPKGCPETSVTKYQSTYSRVIPSKMGPIRCPETSVTTSLRCVTSQRSEDLTPQR